MPLTKNRGLEKTALIFCIRRRIALTFSVFGTEVHLNFLCSAQNLTKTMVRTKRHLQKLWFGQNCPYYFCIRRKNALSAFGTELL